MRDKILYMSFGAGLVILGVSFNLLFPFLVTHAVFTDVRYRNLKIEDKDSYLYKGLPWPAFFINETINKNIKFLGYFYSDNFIFCNLLIQEEVVVPYNEHYFIYNDQSLILKNKLVN